MRVLHGPITAGRARRSLFHRIALAAIPLIDVLPSIRERSPDALARKAARCQETVCGRRYSVPVPAGGTTGSLCVWIHARGCRPQPRNGPGEIADAANGFDDGLACLQPTGGLISLQPKPCEASAPLSWANGIVHRCSCQRSAQTGRRSVPFDQRRSAAALSFFPHVSLTVVSTMPWQPRSSRLQRGSPR